MEALLREIERMTNRQHEATAMMELACAEIKSLREENKNLKVEICNLKGKSRYKAYEENLALSEQVYRYEKLLKDIQNQIGGAVLEQC